MPGAGRPKGARNVAAAGIKELLGKMLPEPELQRRWLKWLNHRDTGIAWEAFKLAQAYQFGKPIQPVSDGERGGVTLKVINTGNFPPRKKQPKGMCLDDSSMSHSHRPVTALIKQLSFGGC